MQAPPGYAERLSERLGSGAADEERVLHTYFVLFAKETTRKHKKWEDEGLLVVKAQGINILRFELNQGCGDGWHKRVFDELVSAKYFTEESVAALFKPQFEFCFAEYDIQIVEEKVVLQVVEVPVDNNPTPQVKSEPTVIDQAPAIQDDDDGGCVILSEKKGRPRR